MLIEKRSFFSGMNGDISQRLLDDKSSLNLMNCRMGVTEFGRGGREENIPGTTQVIENLLPPYGYHKTIGTVIDEQNNRLITFRWNSFGYDGIYCLDISSGVSYVLIYGTQVDTGLNFSKDSLIHSAKVVNGILYWPDGTNNQPRSLDIDAAIKTNHPSYVTDAVPYNYPLVFSELTMIKPPPIFGANIQKDYDAAFVNNFIENESFQFAFQYEYYTREISVVGTYSASSRLNKPNDNYNFITVTMASNETIPNSVRFVNLIVRVGNTAKTVKTWDKEVFLDALSMADQNNRLGVLTYDFYNNITGEALAPNMILKPYDSVPDYAQAYEVAKNRGFFGNTIAGHDTPETTSLSFSLLSTNLVTTNLLKNLIEVRHRNGRGGDINYAYSAWYVYLTGVSGQDGWYELTSTAQTTSPSSFPYPTLPTALGTIAFSGLTWRGATLSAVALATAPVGTYRWDGPYTVTTSNIITITGISISTYDVFKSKSQYKLGVQFFDFAMRYVGGVVTNDALVASIPARNYSYSTGTTGLVWTLDNTDAATEIPDNAYYYAVVMTLNLKTRFFIESFDNAMKYATKDNDGVFTFNSTLYITGSVGIGIDTTALIKSGLGYNYQEGDIALLIKDTGQTYELPVLGQFGNYIVVKSEDIGNLDGARFVYEIYTPYKTSDQEPFYLMGETYSVVDTNLPTREYSITSDTFSPDCYAITRNYNNQTYYAEAMSPNDFYYNRWDSDDGKLSLVTKLGRQEKPHSGNFSNVYIPGTATNGLNSFEAINQFSVPQESGSITKLIVTDKIQDKGSVMLAICSINPNSIYLGEVQILDSTGATTYFAGSDGVIGTINPLKGTAGCINAESVVEYYGLVFWIDVANTGAVVQYSQAGVEPVSRYGMSRFFKRYCQDYLASSMGNLDNINGYHHIRMSIDPFNKELVVSLPGLIYENYANTLPSYSSVPDYATSIINRFDVYDKLQKCMIYKFEENKWANANEYNGEWLEYSGNIMYGYKDGTMWTHNTNTTNWNTFYGTQRPMRLCFTGNLNPSELKVLNNIAIEGNALPDFTVAYADYPNIQITDLASTDDQWVNDEGQFYADFLKDRLSPNETGTADDKLYTGDDLTDIALKFMLEFQAYGSLNYINFVNIGYSVSRGQKQILNPINT
jgi:hypothetical protein